MVIKASMTGDGCGDKHYDGVGQRFRSIWFLIELCWVSNILQ